MSHCAHLYWAGTRRRSKECCTQRVSNINSTHAPWARTQLCVYTELQEKLEIWVLCQEEIGLVNVKLVSVPKVFPSGMYIAAAVVSSYCSEEPLCSLHSNVKSFKGCLRLLKWKMFQNSIEGFAIPWGPLKVPREVVFLVEPNIIPLSNGTLVSFWRISSPSMGVVSLVNLVSYILIIR